MAEKSQSIQRQLAELSRRLEKLETVHDLGGSTISPHGGTDPMAASGVGSCTLPLVPQRTFGPDVSPYREGLIRYIGKKWVNGTKLKFYFFEDPPFRGEASNVDLVPREPNEAA